MEKLLKYLIRISPYASTIIIEAALYSSLDQRWFSMNVFVTLSLSNLIVFL